MNAPMVPPEVLAELQPYVALAQGLARAAVQLVSTAAHGFSDIYISYASSRGDDLDTRLLRAMVIKGILEQARPAPNPKSTAYVWEQDVATPRLPACCHVPITGRDLGRCEQRCEQALQGSVCL